MSSVSFFPEYDLFARPHNEFLGVLDSKINIDVLEKLVLPFLPQGAHIIDLCCGTGQLIQIFVKKGYKVTGIDSSKEVLHYARKNAPGVEFIYGSYLIFEQDSVRIYLSLVSCCPSDDASGTVAFLLPVRLGLFRKRAVESLMGSHCVGEAVRSWENLHRPLIDGWQARTATIASIM